MAGSDELKKRFLGRMTEQPLMASYCVTEPGAGSDVQAITTTAQRRSTDWIVSGNKMWITGASKANWFFILAKVADPSHVGRPVFVALVSEANQPGIEIGRKEDMLGQRCSDTRQLSFNELVVPDVQRVGAIGDGFKIAMKAFDLTRPIIAAGALGLAKRALVEALRYAEQRSSMGKRLLEHQLVAELVAIMATKIQGSQGILDRCLSRHAASRPSDSSDDPQSAVLSINDPMYTLLASMAKLQAAQTATYCASTAIQVLGGIGYSRQMPVEKLYRDSKIFEIYEGTNEIQKIIISRILASMLKDGSLLDL